jgi:hypothetical protein
MGMHAPIPCTWEVEARGWLTWATCGGPFSKKEKPKKKKKKKPQTKQEKNKPKRR